MVAHRLEGDGEPIPALLGFLKDLATAKASGAKYFRTTPEFARAMAEWKKQQPADPKAEQPEPWGVIDLDLDIDLFASGDVVSVSLAARAKPFLTNGSYDENRNRVTWSRTVKPVTDKQLRPPAFCYAVWAEPDAAVQGRHFGKVVLTGQSLADYCTWRASMAPAEAAEWEALLADLKGGAGLIDKLEAFRFSDKVVRAHHGGDRLGAETFLDRGLDKLLEALKPTDKEK